MIPQGTWRASRYLHCEHSTRRLESQNCTRHELKHLLLIALEICPEDASFGYDQSRGRLISRCENYGNFRSARKGRLVSPPITLLYSHSKPVGARIQPLCGTLQDERTNFRCGELQNISNTSYTRNSLSPTHTHDTCDTNGTAVKVVMPKKSIVHVKKIIVARLRAP